MQSNKFRAAPILVPPPPQAHEISVRPLTEPETPQLLTRTRGLLHQAQLEEKIRKV
jgi:hypothetical protein